MALKLKVRPAPKVSAWLLVALGILLAAAGAWMIFPPAGLIVAGGGAACLGLLAIDVGGDRP
jgi:hypothetical protein